jgi:hypothetical protein
MLKVMGLKLILSLVFIIFVILLLVLYWFVPLSTTEFFLESEPSNFIVGETSPVKQFYNNMRFPSRRISYNIGHCPLQKRDDTLRAFDIIKNKTILDFYEVNSNEEITVICESTAKIEGGLFIAGEGGPTNITKAGEFNVITHGKILLLRDSSCPTPNVAIHELLHVLGFDHSENPNDIMYAVSKCGQSIDLGVIETINTLYSIPSYPDLAFEKVSAVMRGKYLDTNISLRNNGFQISPITKIHIYGDGKFIKEIDLDSLDIGHGRVITLTNVWISQINVDELEFEIISNFDELKKQNNKVSLKIKK